MALLGRQCLVRRSACDPTRPTRAACPAGGLVCHPFRRGELRWWDGRQWTDQVISGGKRGIDPPVVQPQPKQAKVARGRRSVRRQVARSGVERGVGGGGTLLTEPVLVVNRRN